jgi:hypothetical protein
VDNEVVELAVADSGVEGTRLSVLAAMVRLMDPESRVVRASAEAIAHESDVSHRTVHNCLPDLLAAGLIEVERSGGGRGRQSLYRILIGEPPETVQRVQTVQTPSPENGAKGANNPEPSPSMKGANGAKRVQRVQAEPSETVQRVQSDPEKGAKGASETVQTVQAPSDEKGAKGATEGGEGGDSPEIPSPTPENSNPSTEIPEGGAGGTKAGNGAKGAKSKPTERKPRAPGVNLAPLFDEMDRRHMTRLQIGGPEQRAAGELLTMFGASDVIECWLDIGDLGRPSDFATTFLKFNRNFKYLLGNNVIQNWRAWRDNGKPSLTGGGNNRGTTSNQRPDDKDLASFGRQ